MGIVLVLLAALIGWAVWSGKLSKKQVLPVILGVGGAALTLRGNVLIGIGAVIIAVTWYRGLTLRLSKTRVIPSDQHAIDKARILLGVSRFDNADEIRARHRTLITQNHPDTGGDEDRAAELNKARDLLLRELEIKPR